MRETINNIKKDHLTSPWGRPLTRQILKERPFNVNKKLLTTRKHNTVEWPEMHNLQNRKYKFSWDTARTPTYTWSYRTSDICVRKLNLCYCRTWDICNRNLHLAHRKDGSKGDVDTPPPTWKEKLKIPLNVSQQFKL